MQRLSTVFQESSVTDTNSKRPDAYIIRSLIINQEPQYQGPLLSFANQTTSNLRDYRFV